MNESPYSRRAAAILIQSPDPVAAALIGATAELAGFRATFPQRDETLRAAVMRVRPSHVLLDTDDAHARDGGSPELSSVVMSGARLYLFGRRESLDAARATAERFEARVVVLPDEANQLIEILTRRPSPRPRRKAEEV